MNNLREIRRRIQTVGNIKKITDAMERVAAARLRRAQIKAERSRPYFNKLKEIVETLASIGIKHPFFMKREDKKVGLVVISSNKGLCGSYNVNLLSAADAFLQKYRSSELELILLGSKALEHYQSKPWPIRYELSDWSEEIAEQQVKEISNLLVDAFLTGELDEVWIIYTHYISVMNREVCVEKFLNVPTTPSEQSFLDTNYILEPNSEEILLEVLPEYCIRRIQVSLNEAYASELAARIIAMQTASKNSEEMITELTLIRNKVRQEGITKEVIEISSGSER